MQHSTAYQHLEFLLIDHAERFRAFETPNLTLSVLLTNSVITTAIRPPESFWKIPARISTTTNFLNIHSSVTRSGEHLNPDTAVGAW
ncbi:hypothetical protein VTL71DRAFT_4230 [Oculimacula yallundae]|uniref:Uncharacterized protein n=1 Tax=Oculimacula yallundae TaxID=86028 RepID=A0ABR4C5A5_9HELO